MQAYAGDTWKFRPNLTVTIGVQYVRDTGRSDSDLPAIPCSAVAASYGSQAPCTGNGDLLTHFGGNSGLGGRVRQPNLNFAPQFGLAWDPGKHGQTVIRAGIGMYYDDNVFATCSVTAPPVSPTASSTPRPMIRAPAMASSFFPATLPRAQRAFADSASETWRLQWPTCRLPSRRPMLP